MVRIDGDTCWWLWFWWGYMVRTLWILIVIPSIWSILWFVYNWYAYVGIICRWENLSLGVGIILVMPRLLRLDSLLVRYIIYLNLWWYSWDSGNKYHISIAPGLWYNFNGDERTLNKLWGLNYSMTSILVSCFFGVVKIQ